jgi:hypothetical protein
LKSLHSDRKIQGNPSQFSLIGFARPWLDLLGFDQFPAGLNLEADGADGRKV